MIGTAQANGRKARLGVALLAGVFALSALPSLAVESTGSVEQRRTQSREEYEAIAKQVSLTTERMHSLAAEIDAVRKDHATITAALIQAAKTEKKLAQDVQAITDRIDVLKEQQDEIRRSLAERRDVLAEVLGALQRMGLNPPPALLVAPEDALSSVRSAILLGSVVPELRAETEILIADLAELSRVTASIEEERARLMATVSEQLAEKERLDLLLKEKKELQARSESEYESERAKAEELASRAGNLKDLIGSLETEIEAMRSAEEKARRAEEAKIRREAALRAMPIPDANRLDAPVSFVALQGQLATPVTGRFSSRFGDGDNNGGVMHGDTLATQSEAIVTAPTDGSVLFAGLFRSYGQLLILDAGDGYHVVLAGMGRISVSLGQSVMAGEPVGAMGEARVASTQAVENGNSGPELYVEFRKDGKPVDPAPWWAERLSGRTGNDT